jgi:hypothetical protein
MYEVMFDEEPKTHEISIQRSYVLRSRSNSISRLLMQSPQASDSLQVKSFFGGTMPDQGLKELHIDERKDL